MSGIPSPNKPFPYNYFLTFEEREGKYVYISRLLVESILTIQDQEACGTPVHIIVIVTASV